MNILWLSHVVPYPPKAGLLLRAYYLMRSVSRKHEVDMVAFVQEPLLKTFYPTIEEALQECRTELEQICRSVTLLPITKLQRPYGKVLTALESLVSGPGYMASWLNSRPAEKIIEELVRTRSYDIAHFDCISLAHYRCLLRGVPVTLGHHNAESHMLIRRAKNERNTFRKLYFLQEGKRLARYERKMAKQFVSHITCSDLDTTRLQSVMHDGHFTNIPNGVDVDFFRPVSGRAQQRSCIFISSMNWYPNVDAVLYLLAEVWPAVFKKIPDARLDIVGSSAPASVIELAQRSSGVTLHGFVPEIRPMLETAALYLCPIRDGGGTKLKILDAFAMEKCVIAHPIACEGIGVTPGKNVIFAETPDEFATAAYELLNDEPRRRQIGAAARELVASSYSFDAIGDKLVALLENLQMPERK